MSHVLNIVSLTTELGGIWNDGRITGSNADYNTAHTTATASADTTTTFVIGQNTTYACIRGFLAFDTSSIPSNATILEATLSLTPTADGSNEDFNINIVQCAWQGPIGTTTPVNLRQNDFSACLSATIDALWQNTSSIGALTTYTSSPLSNSYIQKGDGAITTYGLISSLDQAGTIPLVIGTVTFASGNHATASYRPTLNVTYDLPLTHIDFASTPLNRARGESFSIAVNMLDATDTVVSSATTAEVTLTLSGGVPLNGTTAVYTESGVATFSDLSIPLSAPLGTYTLTATTAGLSSAVATFEILDKPEVAIVRRPDALRRYDIWLPTNAVNGYWIRVGLYAPLMEWLAITSCRSWNSLPIQTLTAGIVRPGRISTWNNLRLTSVGTWTAYTGGTNDAAVSGLYLKYSTTPGDSVSCVLPAGHDRLSYVYKQVSSPGGALVSTSLFTGDNEDIIDVDFDTNYSGATGNYRISERVINIASSSQERTVVVSVSGAGTFYLMSVQSWISTETADPREIDPDDGLWLGNRLIETYTNCYGGSAVSFSHVPNTFTDCYYLCTPNTVDMVLGQNSGFGGAKWTGYGFHYTSVSGTTVGGSLVWSDPNTTLTVTAATFTAAMAPSGIIRFISSGNRYVINLFTSSTVIRLTGNASGESGAFEIFITDYPFTPNALPELSVDGGAAISLTTTPPDVSGMAYGDVIRGTELATTVTGTSGLGGETSITFGQVYTADSIELPTSITFNNGSAATIVYLPSLSGADTASTTGLVGLEYKVTIPPSETIYTCPTDAVNFLPAAALNISRTDTPWVVQTASNETATLLLVAGVRKVYMTYGTADIDPPGIGAHWELNGSVAFYDSTTYTVTANVSGQGSIAVSPNEGIYLVGSRITITAIPSSQWQFSHWTGDLSGSSNPASLLIDEDKFVTAVFSPETSPADTTTSVKPINYNFMGRTVELPDIEVSADGRLVINRGKSTLQIQDGTVTNTVDCGIDPGTELAPQAGGERVWATDISPLDHQITSIEETPQGATIQNSEQEERDGRRVIVRNRQIEYPNDHGVTIYND